jgi:hypothetical protein
MKFDVKREFRILLGVALATTVIFAPLLLRPVSTCVVGDMETRYQARVPESLRDRYLDAQQMRVGLGAAALGGWESLGDAVVVNGQAWLRTTHRDSPNYYRLVRNRYFQSNAWVYVPRERDSAGSLRVAPDSSLQQLLEMLAGKYPGGVIAAGYVHFSELRTIAIAQAAIEGRPILKNAAHYYTRPMESGRDVWAYVVMLSARAGHLSQPLLLPPMPKTSPVTGLVHALRLTGAPANPDAAPGETEIAAVGRVVAEARLKEGMLQIYPITRVAECAQRSAEEQTRP